MADCDKSTRNEFRKGMQSSEIRVTCSKHGVVDKVRTEKDVEVVWEKHLNDVKRGLI